MPDSIAIGGLLLAWFIVPLVAKSRLERRPRLVATYLSLASLLVPSAVLAWPDPIRIMGLAVLGLLLAIFAYEFFRAEERRRGADA